MKNGKALTVLLAPALVLAVVLAMGCAEGGGGEDGTITVTVKNLPLDGTPPNDYDVYGTAVKFDTEDPQAEENRIAVAAEENYTTTTVTFVLEEKDASGDPSGVQKVFSGGSSPIVFIFVDLDDSQSPESPEMASIAVRDVDGDITIVKDYATDFKDVEQFGY